LLAGAWISYALRGDMGIVASFDTNGLSIAGFDPDGPGVRAALQPGDRILSVDGTPVRDTVDFLWSAFGPGPAGVGKTLRVQHAVSGPGQSSFGPPVEVTVRRQALIDRPEFLARILAFTITGVFNLGIGVLVTLARPNDIAARLAMIMGSAIAFSIVAAPLSDVYYQPWVERSIIYLGLLACSALLHFFLVFPTVHPWLARVRSLGPAALRRIGGATAALYVIPLAVSAAFTLQAYSPVEGYSYAVAALLMVAVLALVVRAYRKPPTPIARAQLKWILWAVTIGVVGWVGGSVFPLATATGVTNWSLAVGIVSWSLLPVAIGFAVLRYRLFDVDRVVQATILYAILTALLVLGYVALAFLASLAAEAITGDKATNQAVDVLIALLMAAVAHPARLKLQALLDQTILRDRLRRQRFLQEANDQLGQVQPPAFVTNFLTRHAALRLHLAGAWILLPPAVNRVLSIKRDGLPISPVPLLSLLADATGPILLSDEMLGSSPLPVVAASAPALAPWYALGARLLVPLRADRTEPVERDGGTTQPGVSASRSGLSGPSELIGVWAISARRSQDLYDRADLDVFAHVGQQASVLFDHARLQQEQIEHELTLRELARAHDIQQRLLPTALPNWPGALEIAIRFRSATEMSGDFFDVVALPASDHRYPHQPPLQIAIGDVAGKGIPAALVMAQAQTALRAGAQRSQDDLAGADVGDVTHDGPAHSPARTLGLANALLQTSAGYREFVACALALVEPCEKGARLRLANAGQAPPLLCRGGVATELEPEGERLPLGILPDPPYMDLVIELLPDDAVVFTTDGLAEAPAQARPTVHDRAVTGATGAHIPLPVAPGEFFGFGRLAGSAAYWTAQADSADAVADGIWRDVGAWCGDIPRHDDMTLVVLRVTPSSGLQGEACHDG